MPFLQLDFPDRHPTEAKRRLARRIGEIYARVMETTDDRVRVAIRELHENAGEDFYRPGRGFAAEWTLAEAEASKIPA
jgi:phenylpyruvate tautomerase PptA (4-oxalocrotonate tautomerase family)